MFIARIENERRINGEITVAKVRLIDENGKQRGIVSTKEAQKMTEHTNLDLVEIAPDANPPVCKILDYGKYRYEKQKREKENKKKQHVIHVKEIRLRPSISDHDLLTKLTTGQKFLNDGNKLKITVMFRGREVTRMAAGHTLLNRVIEILDPVAQMEKTPEVEGRRMTIVMKPR